MVEKFVFIIIGFLYRFLDNSINGKYYENYNRKTF